MDPSRTQSSRHRIVVDGAVDEVGLDGSLHTLRHSTASTLVASGVPLRIVAEIGHSSTRLTDEQYSHVAPDLLGDALQRAADAVDRHRR